MSVLIISCTSGNNLKLADKFKEGLDQKSITSDVINLEEIDLPLYNSDEKTKEYLPKNFATIQEKLKKVNGIIFVAPEYNGSVPPNFNNFIAWCSVSSDDWRHFFNGKKAVVATHSGGGGAHVLMHMRMQLSFIGMNVVGREILTNYKKPLNEDSLKAVIDQLTS
ncbi:MAG: NADPH-dependent FMN reductase [Halobacteriovoraceae bacterium]|nr:NADPH-dependent FMN reductase [Halobacteriovoraceae bacterium]